MDVQKIAYDIKKSLAYGDLRDLCEGGEFPPKHTFQQVFWDHYSENERIPYEYWELGLKYLCDHGYLKHCDDWFDFDY